jgi:hypothetical protein
MPIEVKGYVPSVKPGAYQAVCTNVETKTSKADGSEFRVWTFSLTDGSGRTVGASSSLSTSPKSKGGKWLASLLGRIPTEGESVEPVGRACTILVELSDDGYERVTAVTAPSEPAPQSPVRPLKEMTDNAQAQHAIQEGDDLPF